MNRRLIVVLIVSAVCALGAIVAAGQGPRAPEEGDGRAGGVLAPSSAFEGARLPAGVRAPGFTLRDENSRPVRMSDFRGRVAIVTFLYTNCEETCPAQAQQIKGALNELDAGAPALAIAVDPPRDTPESARRFLAEQRLVERMRFALGSARELAPVWRGFGVRPQRPGAEHQGRIVLVDERGFQRVSFPVDQATPERIAHDVRLLERGA